MTGKAIKTALLTLARIVLGVGMMPYALSKVMSVQFQVFPSLYATELGAIDGSMLTWAFLGHTPWFQVVLGVTELVPSVLLLFRRTKLLGALLMLPPTLGVCLVNFAMHLWPETRAISAFFLGLNAVILLGEWRTLRTLLEGVIGPPLEQTRALRVENAASAAVLVAALGGFLLMLRGMIAQQMAPRADFMGERQINGTGAWAIDSLVIDGKNDLTTPPPRLFFDFDQHCVLAEGTERRKGRFDADRAKHTFEITSLLLGGASDPIKGTYERQGERLLLVGTQGGRDVRIELTPSRW